MGAHFKAIDEGVLVAPLDSRYTQVGFNLTRVQLCQRLFFLASIYKYSSDILVLLADRGKHIEGH